MPIDTPWGKKVDISLTQSLNTDTVLNDIRQFENTAPNIANSAIYLNGGLTETSYSSLDNVSGTVKVLSNGSAVSQDSSGGIYVNSVKIGSCYGASFSKIKLTNRNYLDVIAIPDSNNWLAGLWFDGTSFVFDKIDATTGLVLQTFSTGYSVTTSPGWSTTSTIILASFIRYNGLTWSTITTAYPYSDFMFLTSYGTLFFANGATGTTAISVDTSLPVDSSLNLACYKNGNPAGTIQYICSYNNAQYNSSAPLSTWAKTSNVGTLAEKAQITNALYGVSSSSLTLDYYNSATYKNEEVLVSPAGIITRVSNTDGITIPDASPTFIPYYLTPYGGSGLYSAPSGATKNTEIMNSINGFKQTTNNWTRNPEAICLGTTSGYGSFLLWSNNGINTFLGYNYQGTGQFYSNINDYGELTTNTAGATSDIRVHNMSSYMQGAYSGFLVYKTYQGRFVLVILKTPDYGLAREISPGVALLNSTQTKNAIIDTNTMTIYDNFSTWVPAFVFSKNMNTLSPSVQQTFAGIYNQYSTSPLNASWQMDALTTFPDARLSNGISVMTFSGGGTQGLPFFNIYQGLNYLYYGTIQNTSATANTITQNATYSNQIYNTTSTLQPVSPAATIDGGGIIGSTITALQYPGFPMYDSLNVITQVATSAFGGSSGNNVSSIQAFFILYGHFFMFDGFYIYLLNLSGGSTGTLSGTPQKMVLAQGLYFLCSGSENAYFLSGFDNSVYTFDGGRNIKKMVSFYALDPIDRASYSVKDNALYLTMKTNYKQTDKDFTTKLWGMYRVSEYGITWTQFADNTRPRYPVSTSQGTYFVNNGSILGYTHKYGQFTAYNPSVAAYNNNLWFQTAYLSPSQNRTMKVTRISGRWFFSDITNNNRNYYNIIFYFYYQTQEAASTYLGMPKAIAQRVYFTGPSYVPGGEPLGTQLITIPDSGYVNFDWTPNNEYCIGASIGIFRDMQITNETTKVLLLNLQMYYVDVDDTPSINHIQTTGGN